MVRDVSNIFLKNDAHSTAITLLLMQVVDVDTRCGEIGKSYRLCLIGFDTARFAQARELSQHSHCSQLDSFETCARKHTQYVQYVCNPRVMAFV